MVAFPDFSHGKLLVYESVYPVANQHNYGKSQIFMGKSTINGHFQ